MRKNMTVMGCVAVATMTLAGCGGGGSASAAGPAGDAAGIQAAKDYLSSVSANPSGITLKEPLSKAPAGGKYIIVLLTGEPIAKVKSDAMAAAAKVLGWKYDTIAVGATAEGPQQAMQSAISKHPDGISFSGFPGSAFGTAMADAQKAGIPVLADTVAEKAAGPVISTALDNDVQVANWGKMVAAQFVVDSNGTGKGASFTMTEYPILVAWQKALKAAVAQWCPKCELTDVATPATDIGTKLPASVVSTFQRDPSRKYAMFSTGDQTLGLAPALAAAGLSDVKVLGESPTEANIGAIKDGTEAAWTGFPNTILGWRVMDMWARHFNGDDLAPAEKALLPLQMVTQKNINDVVMTPQGNYYLGVKDYQAEFKKLWRIS